MAVELVAAPRASTTWTRCWSSGCARSPPRPAPRRLRDLLLGHAFAGGLGILAAGTPTNNTPHSRSGWSSAPAFPAPDATDPEDGQRPAAEALVAGLDLPDAGFLRGSPVPTTPRPPSSPRCRC